jgi:hypothetical protein
MILMELVHGVAGETISTMKMIHLAVMNAVNAGRDFHSGSR